MAFRVLLGLTLCLVLCGCWRGVSDARIEHDFLALMRREHAVDAEITRISRGDGWADGQEIRVHFCAHRAASPEACVEGVADLSYQAGSDGWQLIAGSAAMAQAP